MERVQSMAVEQKQPIMPDNFPIFEWAPGLILDIPPLEDEDDWSIIDGENKVDLDPMHEPSNNHHVISDEDSIGDNDEDEFFLVQSKIYPLQIKWTLYMMMPPIII